MGRRGGWKKRMVSEQLRDGGHRGVWDVAGRGATCMSWDAFVVHID